MDLGSVCMLPKKILVFCELNLRAHSHIETHSSGVTGATKTANRLMHLEAASENYF